MKNHWFLFKGNPELTLLLVVLGIVAYPFLAKYSKGQTQKQEKEKEQMSFQFEEKIKKELELIGFTISRYFFQPPIPEDEQYINTKFYSFQQRPFAILLDENKKQLALVKDESISVFDILQIRSATIEKKLQSNITTETKKKGTIGRAIVGGAIGGEAGAIIGATTGKEVSKSQVEEKHIYSTLTIQTKNFDKPTFKFIYGLKYFQEVEKWCNIINILIEENKV